MTAKTVVKNVETIVKTVQAGREHLQNCIDFMKIVTDVHDGAASSKFLKRSLKLLCCYGKSIPYLGVFLTFVEGSLPDEEANDVISLLQTLNQQIKGVRDDIRELENQVRWEAVKLQYYDAVIYIETGMTYLAEISQSEYVDRQCWEERLKEHCSNGMMTVHVKSLLKGLSQEYLLNNDILGTIYDNTKGHRGQIELMCIRFMMLFSGGLAVIAAYETLVRGKEASLKMIELFEGDEEKLGNRFEAFYQRCKDCFEENMRADLNKVLDGEISNFKDAAADLSKFLQEKYDWLDTYCIICKENIFIDYNFSGDHVESFNHNARFGVIFYREKCEGSSRGQFPRLVSQQASKLNQVRQIIRETDNDRWFSGAAKINNVLKVKLSRKGISLWGCATVKAKRIVSIPILNIFAVIGSREALDCFEVSGTWTKAVFDVGGHKHLCLLN